MTEDFPGLRFVLEHLSSKEGVEFVRSAAPQVGGTITPYHLMLTRTDWLGYGLRPYMYCMPVIKTPRRTATRCARPRPPGAACYFLGTDSAPHPMARKLHGTASRAVQFAGRDRNLRQGVRGGKCARQARSICVIERTQALPPAGEQRDDHVGKIVWTAPEEIKIDGPDERALVYRGGETIQWKVVAGN